MVYRCSLHLLVAHQQRTEFAWRDDQQSESRPAKTPWIRRGVNSNSQTENPIAKLTGQSRMVRKCAQSAFMRERMTGGQEVVTSRLARATATPIVDRCATGVEAARPNERYEAAA